MNKINGTRPLSRYEIAAGAVINCGDLVAINSDGKAVPASESINITVIGYAENVENGAVEVGDGVVALAGGNEPDTVITIRQTAPLPLNVGAITFDVRFVE